MSDTPAFVCTCCGACCSQLELFGPMYAWLDRGDGVCRYFDCERRLCSVYVLRPVICRVEEGYPIYFSHVPYDEYIRLTMQACRMLEERMKEKERARQGGDQGSAAGGAASCNARERAPGPEARADGRAPKEAPDGDAPNLAL
ncbi:MAG: hypothetical protein Q4F72_08275 [Desulfovibrionaceae bacterium]|nr:hypothetical protein [Desulfovibrionaceae bacterium]